MVEDPATRHNTAILQTQSPEAPIEQFYEPVTNVNRQTKDLDLPLNGKEKNGKIKKNTKISKNTKTNHE